MNRLRLLLQTGDNIDSIGTRRHWNGKKSKDMRKAKASCKEQGSASSLYSETPFSGPVQAPTPSAWVGNPWPLSLITDKAAHENKDTDNFLVTVV
jgi:hypothetical protein